MNYSVCQDDEMDPSDCLELALIPQISTNEQFNAMVDKLTVELMPDETTDDSDEICHIPTIEVIYYLHLLIYIDFNFTNWI